MIHAATFASRLRIWLPLFGMLVLAGCQSTGGGRANDTEALARAAIERADYADAAMIYERLAARSIRNDARRLSLEAALSWLDAGDTERARAALMAYPADTGAATQPLAADLAEAGLAVASSDWPSASAQLDALASQPLTTPERLRYQAYRATVLFATDQPALATSFLTRRELWLTNERAIAGNHQRIWDGLRASDPQVLGEALVTTSDPTVKGWIDLVVSTNGVLNQPAALARVVSGWSRRYRGHPANSTFVPALAGEPVQDTGAPQQVALLLPLSGRGSGAANAIRDGFFAGHIADLDAPGLKPRLRVYDTTELGATVTLQQALDDGADMIVGPLTKTAVGELALQPVLPVPTLALNRLAITEDTRIPDGLYQFGLAPEDEAVAAAERAIGLGLTRAVALAPVGDFGDRVLSAFANRFQALGGVVLDYERYNMAETDFSNAIKRVMQISASISRHSRLQNLLGAEVQYEPRRRQDVDVIFLPANARNARALKPQLKFHFSGDLPTFGTSLVANADGRDSRELAGIEFAEIPWLAAPDAFEPAATVFADYWRGEPQIKRLYALGIDAYRLVGHITDPERTDPLAGASGELWVEADGVVRRRLVWTRFDGENAVPMTPVRAPAIPTDVPWPEVEAPVGSN